MDLILVDENDNVVGYEEKENGHKGELPLHRAFSVLIFNNEGKMLIQKRSSEKKTWPGFWTNACCSSPRKGEEVVEAAKRRLREELGFDCDLKFLFKFRYKARFDDAWGENEIDHVLEGYYDGGIDFDKDEIAELKFIGLDELKKDANNNPEKYTPWFLIILRRLYGVYADIPKTEWNMIE
jgi:isopentenyl-diphosphate delta-isomerase